MSCKIKAPPRLQRGDGWTSFPSSFTPPRVVCARCKVVLIDYEPCAASPEYGHPKNGCPFENRMSGFVARVAFTRKKFRRNARRVGRRLRVAV